MFSYSEYIEDIAIAEDAIRKQKLDLLVNKQNIICDVYCIPSHNHQAFYLKLFEEDSNFTLLYAKTFVADHLGLHTAMYRFKTSSEKEKHNAHVGKIICGIKHLSKSNSTINRLKDCLPTQTEWHQKTDFVIDDVHITIRNFTHSATPMITYGYDPYFEKNEYSNVQKEFLENLYLYIEEIIDNSVRT